MVIVWEVFSFLFVMCNNIVMMCCTHTLNNIELLMMIQSWAKVKNTFNFNDSFNYYMITIH